MKYSHPADRQDKSKIFPQNIQRRFNSAWISFITLWGRNGYSNTLFVTFPALSIIFIRRVSMHLHFLDNHLLL